MIDAAQHKAPTCCEVPLWMDQLLDRAPVPPLDELLRKNTTDSTILITGAGGTIGRELAIQTARCHPDRLILVDRCRPSLEGTVSDLNEQGLAEAKISSLVGSVSDLRTLDAVFASWSVDTVYHAAADKHVALVEAAPLAGIINNTLGTRALARAAASAGVSTFVFISTDKAVRPAGVMGASKRLAEFAIQALAMDRGTVHDTAFSTVRFGNVLGSSGSVVPIFYGQILAGAPVTLTHPEATRYFMTSPEAAQLVIQAGAMAVGGETHLLDMGDPIRIGDLAARMLALSWAQRGSCESKVTVVGLRPGEKLHEELTLGKATSPTAHPRIWLADEPIPPRSSIDRWLAAVERACANDDVDAAMMTLAQAIESYPTDVTAEAR
jgi:FlaA1/EpsC-like NDP-sugar epimerase